MLLMAANYMAKDDEWKLKKKISHEYWETKIAKYAAFSLPQEEQGPACENEYNTLRVTQVICAAL